MSDDVAMAVRPGSDETQFLSGTRLLSEATRAATDRRHQLEIHVDRAGDVLVVAPVGEIDIVTGGLFLEALIAAVEAGESRLIVDLTGVPFMDSTGLAIFVSAHRALRSVGGHLRVVAGARIAGVFELTWMDKYFPLHPDVESAAAAFNR